jgi:chromosome partitioning protein
MKMIAINSIKGGTGKSTLSVLFINALTGAGYKCLVIDADASNNVLSYYLDNSEAIDITQRKTIFDLFLGTKVTECVTRLNEHLDLIRGDARLNEFRRTDSLKQLERVLHDVEYDYCIIDTSPTYDNIIGNVLTEAKFY